MKLKDFQDRFQRAILKGDDAILDDIPDGPRETKTNLLGIYRDAYVLRLMDVIAGDHGLLKAYLGDEAFAEMARAYIAAHPSHNPNARWFSHRLPDFLQAHEDYAAQPVVWELAALERALNDAFDGVDAPHLRLDDLAAIPPERWGELVFAGHPTVTMLEAHTNAAEIWSVLKEGKAPPPQRHAPEPSLLLIWRHDGMSRFREPGAEEAMMWRECVKGRTFGELCQLLAVFDDLGGAPARAAGYLKGWLDVGILSTAVPAEQTTS